MSSKRPTVITGTKALKSQVMVHKATGGNITKVRCQVCQTLAHPVPDGTGGTVLKCGSCGRKYSVQSL